LFKQDKISPELNSKTSRKFFSPRASESNMDIMQTLSHKFLPGSGGMNTFLTDNTPAGKSRQNQRQSQSTLDNTGAFGNRKMTEK
tara:strand:+ start:324 stop:578 length:255 start_codon:yes stop_codon:yes gene_type:complete